MWNSQVYETDLVRAASEAIEMRLPQGWRLSPWDGVGFRLGSHKVLVDAILQIEDPEGRSGLVIVEAKRRPVEARDAIAQAESLRREFLPQVQASVDAQTRVHLMLVAPFLGPAARDRLSEAEVSFADLTGNLRFVLTRPAVFIEAQGATKNPWRENVPLRSLRGRGAGRVVRGFLDYQPPFGIRELAAITESSLATTSRVGDLLEREAIIERDSPRGQVVTVDWERLLTRWAQDYDFIRTNNMGAWLEPRGPRELLQKLSQATFKYAVTGSFAAVRYAPVAEPRLVAIYLEDLDPATAFLGLRPAATGGNVLIGVPFDRVVFDRTHSGEGITYVATTQLAVDLLTGPGRNPAEAKILIEWMRENQDRWQLPSSQNI